MNSSSPIIEPLELFAPITLFCHLTEETCVLLNFDLFSHISFQLLQSSENEKNTNVTSSSYSMEWFPLRKWNCIKLRKKWAKFYRDNVHDGRLLMTLISRLLLSARNTDRGGRWQNEQRWFRQISVRDTDDYKHWNLVTQVFMINWRTWNMEPSSMYGFLLNLNV